MVDPHTGALVSARDEVLRRVRQALGPNPAIPEVERSYRVSNEADHAALADLFTERVGGYQATVHRCPAVRLADVIANALADHDLDSVAVPNGLPLAWTQRLGIRRDGDQLTIADLDTLAAVVTTCALGIAETGTLVLDGGPGQGRRALTLVPDHHVCVIAANQIVASVPEALAQLDARRPITLISGPSATSDIELDRVEGVHGPRHLDVVVVDANVART